MSVWPLISLSAISYVCCFQLFVMVGRFKATDAGRLRAEYNRLVEGLALRGNLPSMWIADELMFYLEKKKNSEFFFDNLLNLSLLHFFCLSSCRCLAFKSCLA